MTIEVRNTGDQDDAAYTDADGSDNGTVIALLKGIYAQLVLIAANTDPV